MCILAMSLALARRQPLTTDSLRIVFVLLVGLGTGICFAAESASSSASQADINNEAQAAYQAGTAAAANNDFKTAEAQFEKVVRLVPQIEEGHSALGAVLAHLGKLPQAIKELETALRLKPGDISAQTNLALAYEQTGANQKAIFLFKSVEADAQRKPAVQGKGDEYVEMVVGRVRDRAFVVRVSSSIQNDPSMTPETRRERASLVAEQVAGILF